MTGAAEAGTDTADVEVPMTWFFWALGAAAVLCLVTQKLVFDMPVWQTVVAIALSGVLALVATRALVSDLMKQPGGKDKVVVVILADGGRN